MTKMIYIPPFQMLDAGLNYYRHLMLPHLIHDERYYNHFKRVKRLGQYIILDNGAAEGVRISAETLVNIAYEFKVDELVLPDVLGDGDQTYTRVKHFISDYRLKLPVSMRLGYVLQGRTAAEVADTYHRVRSNKALYMRISVWYLPRLMITYKHPNARIEVAKTILQDERMPKPIHFLGASPLHIDEGKEIRDQLRGRVRSMDTSAPFVYALAGKPIDTGLHLSRDQDRYFTSLVDDPTRALSAYNMGVMDEWIGAKASAGEL